MNRALAVLTWGAWATLAVEATDDARPGLTLALGTAFALLAVMVPARLTRAGPVPVAAYLAVQLALGFVVFAAADAGVGATLLLMVLVSQSVLLLPLAAAAVVAAVVPLVHVGMGWADGLRSGLGTLAAAAFTAVVTVLHQREQRARAELAEAHERLRGYAAQAEELATTQERNRVARDIHDGLGHHLTVVQMQVQAARAVLPTDPARADAVLAQAQQQATEALAEVRRSVAALRGPRQSPPLRSALQRLAEEASAAGVPTVLEVAGAERELPGDVQESLFRTAQEGLTNVCRHAGAGSARVVLDYRAPGAVRLEVRDDGVGPSADGGRPGFGLVGLRERAERSGGSLTLQETPGGGTTLRVEVPA